MEGAPRVPSLLPLHRVRGPRVAGKRRGHGTPPRLREGTAPSREASVHDGQGHGEGLERDGAGGVRGRLAAVAGEGGVRACRGEERLELGGRESRPPRRCLLLPRHRRLFRSQEFGGGDRGDVDVQRAQLQARRAVPGGDSELHRTERRPVRARGRLGPELRRGRRLHPRIPIRVPPQQPGEGFPRRGQFSTVLRGQRDHGRADHARPQRRRRQQRPTPWQSRRVEIAEPVLRPGEHEAPAPRARGQDQLLPLRGLLPQVFLLVGVRIARQDLQVRRARVGAVRIPGPPLPLRTTRRRRAVRREDGRGTSRGQSQRGKDRARHVLEAR
mmetsp:Transcript_1459/g.3699  ORF Transcript_1459/g.3699 Transcript_1459/m.3699 type:complete len:328 (+) Transcript_1459:1831-2814(+)